MHRIVSFIFTCILAVAVPARNLSAQISPLTRTSVLSSADLRADLALLRQVYDSLHPGLYRYSTRAEIATRFEAVDRFFARDRTLAESFVTLTRLTASIRCGHSYPNFWNQTDAVAGALFEGQDRLPAEFRWIDRRMIVTADHTSGHALPRGTEILSINGVRASEVLDSLMPLARADGGNDAKRIAYLEVNGRDRYHAFDVLFSLVFPQRDTVFTLKVLTPGARASHTVRAVAMSATARRLQGSAAPEPTDTDPLWSYGESDGLGVLTMPTWAIFNSKWDAARWGDSVVTDLTRRGVRDVVIDLRANEGGLDAGDALLARFIEKPLTLPRYQRFVRYRKVPGALDPVLDTWDQSFRDWGAAAVGPVDSLFYRLTRWSDSTGADVITPVGPRYGGRVWVLIDASNSSATFQFALAVKRSGVATLVGTPTGGNRRGINGGAFFFVRLPRTGLEVDLPLIAGFPESDEPNAGVEPDILVPLTRESITRGEDVALEAVRRMVRRLRGGTN
jgi:C-terminal processing protease CtpA/Prc